MLRTIGDVGIERHGQQRVIVEQADRAADNRLAITVHIPSRTESRCPVVLVARKALLHVEHILRRLHVLGRQSNAGQRILEPHRRKGVGQFNVITNAIV